MVADWMPLGGSPTCTDFDRLIATGHASLAGTLDIELTNGCAPTLGQIFPIMTYASHDGAFDRVNGCAGAGLRYAVSYSATEVVLEVVGQPAPNGDLDFNDRIDLRDVAHFQRCFTGAGGSIAPCCEPADLNSDASIDPNDVEPFTSLLAGP